MNREMPVLEPKQEVHLEWPAEFSAEEILVLEAASGIYNTMHRLDQLGMGDTSEALVIDSDETLRKAKKICEDKGHRLESLIEQVQAEAEQNYKAAA